MIILSIIASIPVYFLKPVLLNLFTGSHRFIAQGIPVILSAIIFAILGILLLIITKDSLVSVITEKIKRKIKH